MGDEIAYVGLGERLVAGQGYVSPAGRPTAQRAPLLPLLVAAVTFLGGHSTALRVLMCAVSTLLIPAVFLLGRALLGIRGGLLSAMVAAAFPSWAYSSSNVDTDILTAVLLTVMAWLLTEAWKREGPRRSSPRRFAAGGILLGLACLSRPTSFALIPAVLIWLAVTLRGWPHRVRSLALVSTAIFLVVVPWAVRNQVALGAPVFLTTKGGMELWKSNNPRATGILVHDHNDFRAVGRYVFPEREYENEVERAALYQGSAMQYIREHPARFARLSWTRFKELWKVWSSRAPLHHRLAMAASFGLALPFFLIQVVRRGFRRGPELLLVLLVLFHGSVYTAYTAVVRYRLPIEPLVVVLAVGGFMWSCGRVPRLRPWLGACSQG